MEAFGRAQAVWFPYWSNDYVKAGPDESVKVSTYSLGADGAVMVVSNLGDVEKTATLKIDLEASDCQAPWGRPTWSPMARSH